MDVRSVANFKVAVCAFVALITLGAIAGPTISPAFAASPRTFASTGEGAGQVNAPEGVAVDQSSGAVYVADTNNFRIDKFDAEGNFRLAWGFGVADGTSLALQTCGPAATPSSPECSAAPAEARGSQAPGAVAPYHLAVDQSSGDVYVTSDFRYAVQKFGPDGEFILEFGDEVDKSTGADVCTAADLAAGDECGGGVRGAGPGQIEAGFPPVAVDAAGHVWVGDNGRLEEFSSSGAYLSEVALPGAEFSPALGSLAVDSGGDFYVIDSATEGVQKLSPAGVEIETLDPTGSSYRALALDGAGNLFVSDRSAVASPAVFREFSPAGKQTSQFGAGQIFGTVGPGGIAIGETAKALYSTGFSFENGEQSAAQLFPLPEPGPLISGQRASGVLPTATALTATLDPEGHETTYHFEYGAGNAPGQSTPTRTLAAGFYDEPVEADLTGLIPSTTYHFHLVAEDSEGHLAEGPDETFTTLPAVQIEGESATEVSATSATFRADLNSLGEAAEWWVEYGADESYGSETPKAVLASGSSPDPVSVLVSDLVPGSTYHYRFVARDEREGVTYTVHGEDRTLTTQPAAMAFGLPDGRAWEMVTPSAKSGPVLPLGEYGDLQASSDGDALAYLTTPLSEEAPGSRGTDDVLAQRNPVTGWQSRDLALPEGEVVGVNGGSQYSYPIFTSDLSQAIVERTTNGNQREGDKTPLSPEADEQTPYLRQVSCEGTSAGCYTPLVTGKQGYANVPLGTKFGGAVEFEDATPDLQHAIIGSSVALTSDPAPEGGLYEWSAASRKLQLVSVLPAGGPASRAELGYEGYLSRQALSTDGSRVIFSSEEHIYLRDTATQETVRIDVPQGGSGAGAPHSNFQTASSDGSRVFFTSPQKLTADAGAAPEKPDLYVCEVRPDPVTGRLGCSLSDLTPRTASGEAAGLGYLIPGASEDGSVAYFVANGALAPGAVPGNCRFTAAGGVSPDERCNLYLVQRVAGGWQRPRFIATLSTEDRNDWDGRAAGVPRLNDLTARVSPDGRWLAFMSSRPLTGYDNRDAVSGERDEEVYLYDAAANGGAGQLRCASCNPSGARPHGEQVHTPSEAADPAGLWTDRWLAADIPGWVQSTNRNILRQPRYLSNSGRLFFNSADALSPRDTNGTWDVYEFEPAGVGTCTESEPTYSARNGGCVGLISSGSSDRQSAFIDASESGDDVFFWTHAALSPQDTDTAADIYDAHVCSAASPCLTRTVPALPCSESSSCRGPLAQPPTTATPGSAALVGPGNQIHKKSKKKKHKKHYKKRHRHHGKRRHERGGHGASRKARSGR